MTLELPQKTTIDGAVQDYGGMDGSPDAKDKFDAVGADDA